MIVSRLCPLLSGEQGTTELLLTALFLAVLWLSALGRVFPGAFPPCCHSQEEEGRTERQASPGPCPSTLSLTSRWRTTAHDSEKLGD